LDWGLFFFISGEARTVVGGLLGQVKYNVMRHLFENVKTALEGLFLL
jgi:hypothetical protein